MKGIREQQRLVIEIMTTDAYTAGNLRPSTQRVLDGAVAFCAKYERTKRPFNHDVKQ